MSPENGFLLSLSEITRLVRLRNNQCPPSKADSHSFSLAVSPLMDPQGSLPRPPARPYLGPHVSIPPPSLLTF